jgi:hypothetical protein
MAASVPRFLRQTKLGYLPFSSIVGSRLLKGDGGINMYFDIVMLPPPEFQRMKTNVGLRHVMAPALKSDASFQPGFILTDAKTVMVPEDEPDPEGYAKLQFMIMFGLIEPEPPKPSEPLPSKNEDKSFSGTAKECTVKKGKIRK